MDKPTKSSYDADRRISRLEFGRDDHPANGDYYLRGGICWPESGVAPGQKPQGYALLIGFDIRTKIMRVFEQTEFLVVDHILRTDGGIERVGLSVWFNEAWIRYFCRTFYYNQPESLHKTYLFQTIRSKMIEPKPHFPELLWRENREAWSVVSAKVETDKIKMDPKSGLNDALLQYYASLDGRMVPPAVWSLMCAVYGMERYPWRERKHEAA